MIFKIKYFVLATIIASLMFSCSMQKKHYSKGYSVLFNKKLNKPKSHEIEKEQNQSQPTEREAIASLSNQLILTNEKKINLFSPPDSCDLIILKNGNEIRAKVIDIALQEIKYKKCDNLTGPNYSILKDEVFIIKYINGTKDIINTVEQNNNSNYQNNNYNSNQQNTTVKKNNQQKKEFNSTNNIDNHGKLKNPKSSSLMFVMFLLTLILWIIGLSTNAVAPFIILLSIVGLIATIINSIKRKKHPDIYIQGSNWPYYLWFILSIVLCLIVIVSFLLL